MLWFCRGLGGYLGLLALVGAFQEGIHLWALFSVDWPVDVIRALLAAALLWVGTGPIRPRSLSTVLIVAGSALILLDIWALLDSGTLLPTGFTPFELVVNAVLGLVAINLGWSGRQLSAHTANPHA